MKRVRVAQATAIICVLAMALALAAGCSSKTAPSINGISPASGAPGTEVTISGSGFGDAQGNSTVEFGTVTASVEEWSDSQVKVKVPEDIQAGKDKVTVTTDGGTSDGMDFEVTEADKKSSDSDRKQGSVEKNTPVQAMLEYCKANGIDTTGWTFSVYSVSKSDSSWKIDQGFKNGVEQDMFLLHKVDNKWTVVADAKSFTQEDLAKYKAPSDLLSPQPEPEPHDQAKAILEYLQSKGRSTDNWSFRVAKVSSIDSNWEIVTGTLSPSGETENFLLIWNNMAGDWQVLADGGPPWGDVEFKGEKVPSDLETL